MTGNVVTAMNLGGLKGCIRACEYNLASITYSSHVSLFVMVIFSIILKRNLIKNLKLTCINKMVIGYNIGNEQQNEEHKCIIKNKELKVINV